MVKQIDGCTDGRTYGWMKRIEGRMERGMDGHMD
jgi:hypothetical protein